MIAGVILPTIPATESIVKVAEFDLLKDQQDSLKIGLTNLNEQLEWIEESYTHIAETLQKSVEHTKINPSIAIGAKQRVFLQSLVNNPVNAKFSPSFLAIVDVNGQAIAQNIKVIAPASLGENLPIPKAKPQIPQYQQINAKIPLDFSELPIVKTALQEDRPISGTELIKSKFLQNLGIACQANIGYRYQKIQDLPESEKPFPLLTYPTDSGSIGLAIIVVQPIKINKQTVGLAIVGQLLNRNYQLVDTVTNISRVSTATIFAYDWRISTNVANVDGKSRAIGTRVSREVADAVINHRRGFTGSANIIGQLYRTAYAPLYRQAEDVNVRQPIGILAVAEPETNIQHTIQSLEFTCYGISGSIYGVSIFLILPVSKTFSRSIRRVTEFAQLVGRGEQGIRLAENYRQDEIGILERELNRIAYA